MRNGRHVRIKITGDGSRISQYANSCHSVCNNGRRKCKCSKWKPFNCHHKFERRLHKTGLIVTRYCWWGSLETVTVDIKIFTTVFGIQSSNATYLCVWCKCPADTSVQWSITDTDKGAWTIDKLCSRSLNCGVETYGCIREPLFSSIPIYHIVGWARSRIDCVQKSPFYASLWRLTTQDRSFAIASNVGSEVEGQNCLPSKSEA